MSARSGDRAAAEIPVAGAEIIPAPSRRRKLRLFGIVRLAIAAGILAYLLRQIPLSLVVAAIVQVDRWWLLAAAALSVSGQGVIAVRLRLLSNELGLALTTRRILQINVGAMFYGLFMPAANVARSAVRLYAMAKPTGRIVEAMTAVFFDRLAATAATAILALVAFLPAAVPPRFVYIGWLFVASLAGMALLFAAFTSRTAATVWGRLAELIGFPWGVARLSNIRTSLGRLRAVPAMVFVRLLTLALTAQAVSLVAAYSLATAVGISIGLLELAWIVGAVRLLVILPISPSGLGVREGALVVLLGAYGVPGQEALAFSLLGFATSELLIGLLGGLVEGKQFLRPQRD
ncbi:MAG TPA: lysylphosphatidylglycerol synthase transmembrane domain-containing protein [Gemmatimonadaceae bacterium]|nr:lysylphosphatidylglycerol synthase transmembrane domain-containing protein [Gemmatimonadaceae bacterium]